MEYALPTYVCQEQSAYPLGLPVFDLEHDAGRHGLLASLARCSNVQHPCSNIVKSVIHGATGATPASSKLPDGEILLARASVGDSLLDCTFRQAKQSRNVGDRKDLESGGCLWT